MKTLPELSTATPFGPKKVAMSPMPLTAPNVPLLPASVVTMPGTHGDDGDGAREVETEVDRDRVGDAACDRDREAETAFDRDREAETAFDRDRDTVTVKLKPSVGDFDGDAGRDRDALTERVREAEGDGLARLADRERVREVDGNAGRETERERERDGDREGDRDAERDTDCAAVQVSARPARSNAQRATRMPSRARTQSHRR